MTVIAKETEENRKNHSLAPWLPRVWQCADDQHGSKSSLMKTTSTGNHFIQLTTSV